MSRIILLLLGFSLSLTGQDLCTTSAHPVSSSPAHQVILGMPKEHQTACNAAGNEAHDTQLRGADWVNKFRDLYSYDDAGNQTEWLVQFWRDRCQWEDEWKYIREYDSNGWLMQSVSQGWNGAYHKWTYFWKHTYTYDDVGQLLEHIAQYWVDDFWENREKHIYTYNTNGKMIERLQQNWESDTSDWEDRWKITCTYDIEGNLIEELTQSKFNPDSDWMDDQRLTYTYDSKGNMIRESHSRYEITRFYNSEGYKIEEIMAGYTWPYDVWQNIYKYTYSYDTEGKRVGWLHQGWDPLSDDWQDQYYWTSEYDAEGLLVTEICPGDGEMGIIPEKRIYVYNTSGEPMEIIHQWNYDYSGLVAAEEIAQIPESFTLQQNYPNPFNPTTTISYILPERSEVRLVIHDVMGREITTLLSGGQPAGSYSVKWNGTDDLGHPVSTGVYFCRLQAGEDSQTIKMVFVE